MRTTEGEILFALLRTTDNGYGLQRQNVCCVQYRLLRLLRQTIDSILYAELFFDNVIYCHHPGCFFFVFSRFGCTAWALPCSTRFKASL